ncbi:MAG: hypothetical protein JOZ13_08090 [Alphaproteobacteria bacterium]|nr:hypothetical protein [Alphaproteobacteria bacterium]
MFGSGDFFARLYAYVLGGAVGPTTQASQAGLSLLDALELVALSLIVFMIIWAAASAATRWRWSAGWATGIATTVAMPTIVLAVYPVAHIEGLAITVLSLFVGCIVWQEVRFSDHQKKFDEHDKSIVEVFEQNSDLNAEARRLHILALSGLKSAQVSLLGRFEHDAGFYVETFRSKLAQILSQIANQEVYVRDAEFGELWKKLVDSSKRYVSVCDLSFYADVTVRNGDKRSLDIFEGAKAYWLDRLGREISELVKTQKTPTSFQKLIVYEPLRNFDEPDKKPKCVTEGRCHYVDCTKKCVVKVVAQRWKESERQFAENARTFARLLPNHDHGAFIWLVRKDEIDTKFAAINSIGGGHKTPLDSFDIGLFGAHFVGEEFKVPAGTSEARTQDFLYRVRFDESLANRIRTAFHDLSDVELTRVA